MFNRKKFLTPYFIFFILVAIGIFTIFLLYNKQIQTLESDVGVLGALHTPQIRGDIFFTDKDGKRHLVASTHTGYNLNISPIELGDEEEIYEHLSELIDIDKETFFLLSKKTNDHYETLEKDLSSKKKKELEEKISNYRFEGVWLEEFKKRIYPFEDLGAHIIGFVSTDAEGNTKGQYGIERAFDDVLSLKTDNKQKALILSNGNILLTIDIDIQQALEKELKAVQEDSGAEQIGGVVLNPNTGAIYALGVYPSFNLNTFNEEEDYSIFNNPIVEDVYEMGSIFKPLTIAIGLDSERISKDFTYHDSGKIKVGIETISNHDKKGHGPDITLQTILSKSLNTGSVSILLETGIDTYKDYFDRFQFNGTTKIDLPKEIPGLTSNLEKEREIEFATASFGQGIAVTPIAAARALATLANGGVLVQPYVVQDIETIGLSDVMTDSAYTRERKRIFKKETTEEITRLLTKAYDRSLAGGKYRSEHYTIAAKTGTAQIVNPENGTYEEGKFLHSFFGYFPAKRAEFFILLFAVNPDLELEYASDTLAEPFSNLSNTIISNYKLLPDRKRD